MLSINYEPYGFGGMRKESYTSTSPAESESRGRFSLRILYALPEPLPAVMPLLQGRNADILPHPDRFAEFVSDNSYHIVMCAGDLALIGTIKSADPRAEIIMFGDKEDNLLEAIKLGAFAYFIAPFSAEQIAEAVGRIEELFRVRRETAEIEKLLNAKYTFAGVVGRSTQILEIVSFIERIVPYYRTVAITGETGTGKEAVARALHAASPVADYPFLVCNCGALVENLIQSELFGHMKGSFTGAVADKAGLFEAAGEGTIVLDEIGDIPLSFQPHLLRVLENGEFRRVGSNRPAQAKCRVIALTNKDLETEVKKGRFREDLFFRLTRLTIKVPPLRERKEDIPLLCHHFMERFNQRSGKKILGVSRPAQTVLMLYNWPGNVRELESAVEEASILTTESFIRLQDIPAYIREAEGGRETPRFMSLADAEKQYIERVLGNCDGNKSRAALILDISRRALLRKMEKFNLPGYVKATRSDTEPAGRSEGEPSTGSGQAASCHGEPFDKLHGGVSLQPLSW
jgi:DNA-binding NtrC family response regulator